MASVRGRAALRGSALRAFAPHHDDL